MTPLSRRQFLWTAAASSLALPLAARQELSRAPGRFRHGVASGDPHTDRVILWTRISPSDPFTVTPITLRWRVATDERMRTVVARGQATTDAARDFTVKVDATGLAPGRTYYYAFDVGGEQSPIGRTRTLPAQGTPRLRVALVSCSNYPAGFFNVYGCINQRPDLDAIVHVGDYIYEFAEGEYGVGQQIGRVPEPAHEAITLADYRMRYATYRTDPDLQEAHRLFPFIAVWDDHEITNDAWSGGAINHNPEKGEGSFAVRQRAAYQAYLEWMPIRESRAPGIQLYRTFNIGGLVDLIMLDTRGLRDRQASTNDAAAIADPNRTLLGATQERWLFDELRSSVRTGTSWRLLGQQVVFSQASLPGITRINTDGWDGYQGQRTRVLDVLERESIGNVAILTGDAHSSWGFDVGRDPWHGYRPATGQGSLAVEIVTPAISSPPFFGNPGDDAIVAALKVALPHLKFMDGTKRGYVLLDVTRDRLTSSWYFVPDVRTRVVQEVLGGQLVTESGSSHWQKA
jgi:alkaline phosphatase D